MLGLNTIRRRVPHQTSLALAMSAKSTISQRILCYGDSLTAGVAPPSLELFPYAPYLEKELHESPNFGKTTIRHRGLSGWTSSQMLDDADGPTTGLRSAIRAVKDPPLSLVIILAGTNDLGYGEEADLIAESVVALHKMCFTEGVPHTIAIGVPPSGYQSAYKDAADKAKQINYALKQFCQSSDSKSVFFPFPFHYAPGDANWSPDTLHFSRQGYKVLGESLAPIVQEIISSPESM